MAKPTKVPDEWIRNRADELAVEAGCLWDEERGEHFIETVENNFRLYEGTNFAGELMRLLPYQRDYCMRLFSWVRWSDFAGRYVRRFRRAGLWVPKKNGKSPLAAAVGLYLTVADGEYGGKTFAVAKDGQQARIVHDHALKMVEQSEELLESCHITLNPERRITHKETLNYFGIMPGDNIDGQEGKNGNAIIDEAHVVNNRLARVLKYMGASRQEPLEASFSTAGDQPEGWGKQRRDYGIRVNSGEVVDLEFLHQEYAAPQDATDQELRDPKLWRFANPAIGYILDEERFGQELEQAAQGSLQEWSDFKKYRFNIWQLTASPWLPMSAWQACDTDADLIDGEDTWCGLDLSAVSDFTAFAMVQKQGDSYVCRVRHFVPETRALQYFNAGLPIREWERDGWVTVCPNGRIDYEQVVDAIDTARNRYNIVSVGFDKAMAEPLRQWFEPLGLTMVEIPQNFHGLNNPSQNLRAIVEDRKLCHGGDPVLSWMAQHVTTKPDDSSRIRPVKPLRSKLKAIDGIVALIMAIGQADASEGASIYNEPGATYL